MDNRRGWVHMAVQYCLLALGAFVLGYMLGRIESIHARLHKLEEIAPPQRYDIEKPRKWFVKDKDKEQPGPKQPISIDTSTFVTEVSTAGLEKPAAVALGEKKTVQDDIQAAASKLAQLKRS